MQTSRQTIDPVAPDPDVIAHAAAVLLSGGLVAFPTETVYGLGALATSSLAVQRIFDAKSRPSDDPLIVHVHPNWPLDIVFSHVPTRVADLAERVWPGPLTLIGERADGIDPAVSGGLTTVAARSPAHPVALSLLCAVNRPIAAPSANLFGHVSPTSADHVLDDLDGRCDLILDAGDTPLGIESTVIRIDGGRIAVLRHGAYPIEDLGVEVDDETIAGSALSPGTSLRHYSPMAPMAVVDAAFSEGLPPGPGVYLGYDDNRRDRDDASWDYLPLGDRHDLGAVAAVLYKTLRAVDRADPVRIIAELTGESGLGRAIDDRLVRAAAGEWYRPG